MVFNSSSKQCYNGTEQLRTSCFFPHSSHLSIHEYSFDIGCADGTALLNETISGLAETCFHIAFSLNMIWLEFSS
jgi:hypothetical protein